MILRDHYERIRENQKDTQTSQPRSRGAVGAGEREDRGEQGLPARRDSACATVAPEANIPSGGHPRSSGAEGWEEKDGSPNCRTGEGDGPLEGGAARDQHRASSCQKNER